MTDFGLSKKARKIEEKSKSFCGTPEYMAPEIVWKTGHNFTADWWTFGAFIYEMVTGFPPFSNENEYLLFKSIQCTNFYLNNFLS